MIRKEIWHDIRAYKATFFIKGYARSGFGCEPHSSGRAVFATCLSDGETARWNREDFIGVLDDKFLPGWAREKLEELMTQEQTDAPTMGGMKMK